MKIFHLIITLFTLLGVVSCAPHPPPFVGEISTISTTGFNDDKEVYPPDNGLFTEYRIAPGDLLDVLYQIRSNHVNKAFKIAADNIVAVKFVYTPELNEEQNVKPDGTISLPYIGEVFVVNKTATELNIELKEKYKDIFIDPQIYVTIPEFSAQIKALKADLKTAPRGLSRLVTVRPDGYTTFPLLGEVFVAGLTIKEVDTILDQKYEEVLTGLTVDLFLEKTSGSVIYVTGEVKKPGSYPVVKPISVFQSLILAGGHTKIANLESILVLRRTAKRKFIATQVNLEDLIEVSNSSTVFYLRQDDIVYVPRTKISSAAELMRNVGDIFLFNGWGLSGEMFGDYMIDFQK